MPGHRFRGADIRLIAEDLRDGLRFSHIPHRRGRGVSIDIIDLVRSKLRIFEGQFEASDTSFPGRDRHVIPIAVRGETEQLSVNSGPTLPRMLQLLQDYYPGSCRR